MGAAARRASPPVFYAFRDREYVLNQIESATGGRFHPNFDRIGGLKDDLPKGWIDDTKAAMDKIRDFCDEIEDLAHRQRDLRGPHPRHRRHPRRRRPVLRPVRAPTSGPAASTGTSAATCRSAWPTTRSTGRSGPTPTATRSPATGCASRRSARRRKIVDQLLDGLPAGPIMAKVPRIIKVPAGEAYVATENPLGAMGYYVVSQGRPRPVPGEDPHADRSTTSRSCRGCCAASTCPTSSRSSPASTSSSETSTDDVLADIELAVLAADDPPRSVVVLAAVLLPAGTFVYVFLFKMVSFMQSRLGPMEAGPYGSLQLLAEVGKFLQKEDIVPERADRLLFKLAPVLVRRVDRAARLRRRCPFGPDAWFADLDVGIFYALAVSSVSVIGVLMAGWASANKYSLHRRPAGRRPAHRLRAADGARRRRRGHPGRHAQPAGHRRAPRPTARSSASAASATRTSSPSSSASSSS